MSDRLPSFKYSHEILHDTTPTQDPTCLQTEMEDRYAQTRTVVRGLEHQSVAS